MATTEQDLERWLRDYVEMNGGAAGTVHVLGEAELELRASMNIPPEVVEVVQSIAKGKGMAGLAWERNDVVSTCNLKTDETGDVRPGAKAVDANAAVAIPVHDAGGEVRGVVGIAYKGEYEMGDDELAELRAHAECLPA